MRRHGPQAKQNRCEIRPAESALSVWGLIRFVTTPKGKHVRVVGYAREAAAEGDGEPAFTQGERLRAWSRESSHRLVAVFQDTRQPGVDLGWDGYRAMLDLVDGGRVDAVLVSSLASLSPDLITQEAMVWDLRNRGVAVV